MKKILITGGAGYIGSVLTHELLNLGHEVTVIDNFMYSQNSLSMCFKFKTFKVENYDVRNLSSYEKLIKENDIIIPLAALVGAPICKKNKIGAKTINYDAIINLFENISKNQVVLMPTTNSAYGSGDKNNFCDENSPLNPLSEYAIDKVNIEKRLLEFENSISLRLATVFGMSPRMRTDLLVNDFTLRAVKDKFVVLFESSFKRNYIHVMDVVGAFIHSLKKHDDMKGNIYNVGLSEANLSKKELCLKIKDQIPDFSIFESEFNKDPDQRNYIVSNAKIEKTGFKPKYTIEYGITELIKGYKTLKTNNYANI